MADYNQNIKVTANTKGAEQELSKLDKILKGLSSYTLDLGKGAAQAGVKLAQRNLQDYGRTLGAIDRQLGGFGKRLGDIAKAFDFAGKTAVGVAGINALGTALAALPKFATGGTQALQAFGGVLAGLSAPATKVAAALAALGPQGLATAGGIAAATAAFMAFSPAVRKVVTGLDNLALGGKIQAAIGGMKGKVEETKQSFLGLNTTIETTVKAMNELAEGMSLRQLNSQVSSLTKEMQSFHSSTQGAWEAAQGLVRAQKAQVVEQRALNDLVRQAKGLQPQDVRDAEVSRRKTNLTSGRNAQQQLQAQAKETEQLQQALLRLEQASAAVENGKLEQRWKLDQAAAAKLREETEALAANLARMARASSSTGIRKTEASAAVQERKELERTVALMRERNALLRGNANQYAGMAGPGNDTRANQPQYRQMLNEQVLAARNLGKERRTAMELADRELSFELRLEKIMERRAALAKQGNQQRSRRDTFGAKLEGAAIGGSFPLLFGGGAGSVIGGALGGLNTSNPIFSVFTSAIGQMLDQFAAAAQDTGKALRDPITNFQKIADAGLLAGKSQEYYISKLIEVGRVTEAAAIVQGEMVKKIGVNGVNDLTKLGESSDKLAKAWAELNLQMQAALAGPLAALLEWITSVVRVFGQAGIAGSEVKDILKGLSPAQQQAFQREMLQNNQRYGTSPKALEEERKILDRYRSQAKPEQLRPTAIDPRAQEAARQAAQQLGDQIKSAYREAFDLQRRGADIQREMVDYRRKVESDIFAKQQEAKRLEIDNARKAAQINIEQTDLALRKQFAGSQGLTGELLNGVRAYISARRSGEADIEQKRRQLEVNLADITKATADYAYEQANRRMQLERSIEDYKRDIADYQLKIARQIQELAPIGGGAAGGGAPVGNLGGFAGLSQLIGSRESYGGNYGAFNRGGSNNGHTAHGSGVDPNLVNMTVAEIQRRQLAPGVPANQQLHAVGKYQIIGSTLRSLLAGRYGPTGVSATDKFSPEVQERLGSALARNRMVPGNVDASVRGLRQEWIGLQYANTDQLRAAVRQFQGAPATQLGTAASSVTAPTFHAPAANTAGFADAQSRVAEAQKKSVELERQHNQLKQQAAAFDVQELARGQSQVQQTQRQLELEKNKLTVLTSTGGISENEVALLAQQLEGESKIAEIVTAQKDALLAINTAVKEGVLKQTEADVLVKQINTGVEKRLEATRTQIGLEQELLKVQQAQQLAVEAQAMQRKLATTGQGIRAGYTGGASGKYDDILGRTGDSKLAGQFAGAQSVLDQLENAQSTAADLGGSIAGGFKDVLKAAITGGDIQGAFASMLGGLGEKFLDMAFKPIEQALTQAIFGMLAPSNSQLQAAQIMLAAAQQQIQAATMMAGGGGGGFGGAGGILGGLGSLFGGGGGLGAAASGVAFNPIAFTPGLSFFADGGFVTGPTKAVVGEGGANEYVIPENKMGGAMARWSAGARGDAVVNGADPTSSGGVALAEGPPQINISGGVLQFDGAGYIRQEQLPSIISQASKQGEALAMRRLQMNPSTRRKVGIA